MPDVLEATHSPEPFRWKLFVFVMVVMGAITTAAILLTLRAHPRRGTVRVPPPQPVSRAVLPLSDQPKSRGCALTL